VAQPVPIFRDSAQYEVPRCTTSQAAAFFYALTTQIRAPLASSFQAYRLGFGLSSGVFFTFSLIYPLWKQLVLLVLDDLMIIPDKVSHLTIYRLFKTL